MNRHPTTKARSVLRIHERSGFFLLTKQIAVLGRLDRGVVGSWAEFSEFCEASSARGLEHNPAVEHRFRTAKGIIIDVVPFGGLADANGFIS